MFCWKLQRDQRGKCVKVEEWRRYEEDSEFLRCEITTPTVDSVLSTRKSLAASWPQRKWDDGRTVCCMLERQNFDKKEHWILRIARQSNAALSQSSFCADSKYKLCLVHGTATDKMSTISEPLKVGFNSGLKEEPWTCGFEDKSAVKDASRVI